MCPEQESNNIAKALSVLSFIE